MRHPASYISEHLLVCLTLAFIAGITLAPLFSLAKVTLSHFGFGLFIFLGFLIVLHCLRWRRTIICLILPCLAALGFYHAQLSLQMPLEAEHIFNRIKEKTEITVVGTLATSAEFDGKTSQVLITSEFLRYPESPELVPTNGKILLHFQGSWPTALVPGDKLIVRADLKRPDSSHTPGVFDYTQHLARTGIWISGFVRSPLFLQKLEEKQSLLHSLLFLPERIRTKIGQHIDISVPVESQGLYRAILIGDRSRVDDTTLEAFKGSGTMHILAISGLHMTVIGALLYTIFYWLLCRSKRLLFRYPLRKWAAFLCLPVLLGYGLLAGLNTPVFRAVIMSCIVIVAVCADRPKSPSTLLASAAMIILTVEPLALLTASFQLSFVATAAILFLFPILHKLIHTDATDAPATIIQIVGKWLLASLMVSLVATLATAPITIFAFNRFSPVGIFANLIVEPLICLWSLPAGFLSIPFILLQPEISTWLFRVGALGLNSAVHVATFFSNLPFSTIWLPTPHLSLITGFYAGLFGLCLCGKLRSRVCGWPSLFTMLACLILMAYPLTFQQEAQTDSLQMSFLDVGQGSSTLIQFPSGYTVLVDGGGSSSMNSTVGERIIAPYLWHKGIRKLDAVVITHPDADHYNGLGFILQHFSPEKLWIRDKQGHEEEFRELLLLAKKLQIEVITPQSGMRLGSKEGHDYLECIANTKIESSSSGKESRNQTNSGIIAKACSKNYCALFPGDIGRKEESYLIENGYDLSADILLAPHHGSITSNSPEFLTAVSPTYLIVSAGRGGRGHFPHGNLQNDCDLRGITLLKTTTHGTLETKSSRELTQIFGYAKKNNNPLLSYEPIRLSEKTAEPL